MSESIEALDIFLDRNPDFLESVNSALFINAHPHPLLSKLGRLIKIHCIQSFRPTYNELAAMNLALSTRPEGLYDLVVVQLGKHKEDSLAQIGAAGDIVNPDGTILAFGSQDVGAKSIEKSLKEISPEIESFSKKHARVIFANRSSFDDQKLKELQRKGAPKKVADTDYVSVAGAFSFREIDKGSALLANQFESFDIEGIVADFGAGWGFLSCKLLESSRPMEIHLYEGEAKALECAKLNLASSPTGVSCSFYWSDILKETPANSFNWIIMNPPLHVGKKTDVELGQKSIEAALRSLYPKGQLLMVANRSLPYEKILKAGASEYKTLVEDSGFKVLHAVK